MTKPQDESFGSELELTENVTFSVLGIEEDSEIGGNPIEKGFYYTIPSVEEQTNENENPDIIWIGPCETQEQAKNEASDFIINALSSGVPREDVMVTDENAMNIEDSGAMDISDEEIDMLSEDKEDENA